MFKMQSIFPFILIGVAVVIMDWYNFVESVLYTKNRIRRFLTKR